MFGFGLSPEHQALRSELQKALALMGMPISAATTAASEMVETAIAKAKKLGVLDNRVDPAKVLQAERTGALHPAVLRELRIAREEGATDEDIKEWIAGDYVEIYCRKKVDELIKTTVLLALMEQEGERLGPTASDAAIRGAAVEQLYRSQVRFGDPGDEADLASVDRRLPWHLKSRIMRWIAREGPIALPTGYRMMNAYIRACIRERRV
jgi:hypothetical protein